MSNYRRRMMQKQEDKVIDLSLQDIYGNPINRSTANCYVVRETGQYKFPLVYGNAIKNGQVNAAAYTNKGGANSHDFVDFLGAKIENPYIPNNNEEALLVNSDEPNIFSDLKVIEDGGFYYIQFTVNSIPDVGANGIISYDNGLWSIWHWHIWLWPHDLSPVEITNSTGVKYNIMPVNLASKYDSDGVHIKNWFYQWGRMTPMLLPSAWNSTTDHTNGTIFKTGKATGVELGVRYPTDFYYNSASPYNWFGDKLYYNLWDAACVTPGSSDNDTVKTVYDPCPVGWKVPNGNAFTGLSVLSSTNGIVKMGRYSGDTVGVGFPLSGYRREIGDIYGTGTSGNVWTTGAMSSFLKQLKFMDLDSSSKIWSYFGGVYGNSIRPVQDDLTKIDEL